MRLLRLLLVSCLLISGCSSMPPQPVPVEIPMPPAALLGKCPTPDDLPDMATAKELSEFALGWVRNAACERARSIGLLQAWPR